MNDKTRGGLEFGYDGAHLKQALRQKEHPDRVSAENRRTVLFERATVPIFNSNAVRRELTEAGETLNEGDLGPDSLYGSKDDPDRSREEDSRVKALLRLYRDPRGPRRPVLVADDAMIERLSALRAAAPNFISVIDLVIRAAKLSRQTSTALRVAPLLLLGPPGVGKTYLARKLAEAIGSGVHRIAMNTVSDNGLLFGHPTSWKGAKVGLLTRALIEAETASPVIFMDELDKLRTHDMEDPFAPLLTLLERENAQAAMDEYLLVKFDFTHSIIIATANDVDLLPAPIQDRLLSIVIAAPDKAGLIAIARNMLREAIARLDSKMVMPGKAVLEALAARTPRQTARLIELALGFAAEDGRKAMIVADLIASERLMGRSESRRIGFFSEGKVS